MQGQYIYLFPHGIWEINGVSVWGDGAKGRGGFFGGEFF